MRAAFQREPYRRRNRTTASVTVSPRRSASSFAACHTSWGTRMERGGVCFGFIGCRSTSGRTGGASCYRRCTSARSSNPPKGGPLASRGVLGPRCLCASSWGSDPGKCSCDKSSACPYACQYMPLALNFGEGCGQIEVPGRDAMPTRTLCHDCGGSYAARQDGQPRSENAGVPFLFRGDPRDNRSGPRGARNTTRGLTHSLALAERGLR